jgi:hypothetical protein
MTEPLSPKDIAAAKVNIYPSEVFDVVNGMIASQYVKGQSVTIKQDDVIAALIEKLGVDRGTIFNKGWLNFEAYYQKAGWLVEYDKPGYNESYGAYWKFREMPKRRSTDK